MNQENVNKEIVIDTTNNVIKLYENNHLVKELKEVIIGKNGIRDDKKEGDLCTPRGTYNLGFAFGTIEDNFNYPYFKLNDKMYWVSDSNSKYYNEFVEISSKKASSKYDYLNKVDNITWSEAEHLIDYPIEYELAIVIEYNMYPKVAKKGSAIFFHVKNKETTSGCVATTKENLLYIIRWLDKDKGKITIK